MQLEPSQHTRITQKTQIPNDVGPSSHHFPHLQTFATINHDTRHYFQNVIEEKCVQYQKDYDPSQRSHFIQV
jgi:hypothetical protein